jgi:hypothetical protein
MGSGKGSNSGLIGALGNAYANSNPTNASTTSSAPASGTTNTSNTNQQIPPGLLYALLGGGGNNLGSSGKGSGLGQLLSRLYQGGSNPANNTNNNTTSTAAPPGTMSNGPAMGAPAPWNSSGYGFSPPPAPAFNGNGVNPYTPDNYVGYGAAALQPPNPNMNVSNWDAAGNANIILPSWATNQTAKAGGRIEDKDMPLTKSASPAAFKDNLKAELAAGKPRAQALAIAYDVQRRHRAGGGPSIFPHLNRAPIAMPHGGVGIHTGPIKAPTVPGRTDRIPMKVASNSYVLPADVVSHLGQNNSDAGHSVVGKLFPSGGPGGSALMGAGHHGIGIPKPPRAVSPLGAAPPSLGFYEGGVPDNGTPAVDVIVAGGEHVLSPQQVLQAGKGDYKRGHEVLDKFVKLVRADHIKTLKKLPGPVKDGTK